MKENASRLSPVKKITVTPREFTDVGNAQRLIDRYGDDLKYVQELGWLCWDGKVWQRDELKARKKMIEVSRAIYSEAATFTDRSEQNAAAEHAKKSQQAQRIQSALYLAQPDLAANAKDFDQMPWWISANNGSINLKIGEVSQHDRNHLNTRIIHSDFSATAKCPTWLKFLERVQPDPEMRQFLQRAIGYSLTGDTGEQCLFFLYGMGRNGKSVVIETLAELMGSYHTATRIESLSGKGAGGIPNDIAALAGARYVTVSETPEGAKLNESLVKDLTGGDTITARFLRHEFFSFRPQFKLWVRGNHKPQIRGTDDGIWRRLMLIPFNVQIPEDEVDSSLPERLRGELPGILNWAIDGCLDWQKKGLKPPQSVKDALAEYRREMDILGDFISACCVISDGAITESTALYNSYRKWCGMVGHLSVSQMRFGLSLGERGFVKEKSGTVKWKGIGLPGDRCNRCSGEGCEWCFGE